MILIKIKLSSTQWEDSCSLLETANKKRGLQLFPQIILASKIANDFFSDVWCWSEHGANFLNATVIRTIFFVMDIWLKKLKINIWEFLTTTSCFIPFPIFRKKWNYFRPSDQLFASFYRNIVFLLFLEFSLKWFMKIKILNFWTLLINIKMIKIDK